MPDDAENVRQDCSRAEGGVYGPCEGRRVIRGRLKFCYSMLRTYARESRTSPQSVTSRQAREPFLLVNGGGTPSGYCSTFLNKVRMIVHGDMFQRLAVGNVPRWS